MLAQAIRSATISQQMSLLNFHQNYRPKCGELKRKINMKKASHNRGFTLIELVVVLGIIGLISSVAIASLSGARDHARSAQAKAETERLLVRAKLYLDDYGSYPACDKQINGQDTGASICCPV